MSAFRMELFQLIMRARALHVLRAASGSDPELSAEEALREMVRLFFRYDAVVDHYLDNPSEPDLTEIRDLYKSTVADKESDPSGLLKVLEAMVEQTEADTAATNDKAVRLSPKAREMVASLQQIPLAVPKRFRQLRKDNPNLSYPEFRVHADPLFAGATTYHDLLVSGEMEVTSSQFSKYNLQFIKTVNASEDIFYDRIDQLLKIINTYLNVDAPHA